MDELPVVSRDARRHFAERLARHLAAPTRPKGQKPRPWGNKELSAAAGVSPAQVRNWRRAENIPTRLERIEVALFGDDPAKDDEVYQKYRKELRELWEAARQERKLETIALQKAASQSASTRTGADRSIVPAGIERTRVEAAEEHRTISNLPPKAAHLVDQSSEFSKIREALASRTNELAIVVLHGMPGVGKTTTALTFGHENLKVYRAIRWIRAHDEASMRSDLFYLGVRLGWFGEQAHQEQALEIALNQLCLVEDSSILLIYDNAESLDAIHSYLPPGGSVHVLVTSRGRDWRIAHTIELKGWSKEVGANYLVSRLNRPNDRAAAEQLSFALEGLPLALEQAVNYCSRLGTPFAVYEQRVRARTREFLDDERHVSIAYHRNEPPDRRTVAGTISLALDMAATKEAGAERLIGYAALLSPDSIPTSLFERGHQYFRDAIALEFEFDGVDRAIAALRDFSLVYADDVPNEHDILAPIRRIRLHRVVREIVRWRFPEDERVVMRRELAAALSAAFPPETYTDPRIWPRVRLLEMHARQIVTDSADDSTDDGERLVYLLNLVAEYEHGRGGNFLESKRLYEKALEISKGVPNPKHPTIAMTLHGLAWVTATLGDYKTALRYFLRALNIRKQMLGRDHADTAETLHRIAWVYVYLGRFKRAEKCLGTSQKWLAEWTSAARVTLGWLYFCMGRYEEALSASKMGRDSIAKSYGPENSILAAACYNIGLINLCLRRYRDADAELEQARKIREKVLGLMHSETAKAYTGIGQLRMEEEQYEKADQAFRIALRSGRAAGSAAHPDYARAVAGKAELRMRQGRLAAAERFAQIALSKREAIKPANHPDIAHSRLLLARIWMKGKANSQSKGRAKSMLIEAITALEGNVSEQHVWLKCARATLEELQASSR